MGAREPPRRALQPALRQLLHVVARAADVVRQPGGAAPRPGAGGAGAAAARLQADRRRAAAAPGAAALPGCGARLRHQRAALRHHQRPAAALHAGRLLRADRPPDGLALQLGAAARGAARAGAGALRAPLRAADRQGHRPLPAHGRFASARAGRAGDRGLRLLLAAGALPHAAPRALLRLHAPAPPREPARRGGRGARRLRGRRRRARRAAAAAAAARLPRARAAARGLPILPRRERAGEAHRQLPRELRASIPAP